MPEHGARAKKPTGPIWERVGIISRIVRRLAEECHLLVNKSLA